LLIYGTYENIRWIGVICCIASFFLPIISFTNWSVQTTDPSQYSYLLVGGMIYSYSNGLAPVGVATWIFAAGAVFSLWYRGGRAMLIMGLVGILLSLWQFIITSNSYDVETRVGFDYGVLLLLLGTALIILEDIINWYRPRRES